MTGTGRTPARDFRSWPFPEATPAAVWPPGRGDAWLILHGPPPALSLVLTGQRLASWVVFRLLSLICPSYQHPRAPTVGPPWALHWAVIVVKSRAELRGSDRQCGGFVMGDPHRHGGWKDGGASQASERRGVGGSCRAGGKGPGPSLEGPSGPEGEEKASEEQSPRRLAGKAPVGPPHPTWSPPAFVPSAGEPPLCLCLGGSEEVRFAIQKVR